MAGTDEQSYWHSYFDSRAKGDFPDHARVGYTSAARASFMHRTILELLGPTRGQRILDIGCGDGQLTAALSTDNFVVGCDFSVPMADAARERGLKSIAADLTQLPFAGEKFDIVMCVEAITCLSDPPSAVDALSELVRPGGRMVLSGLNQRSWLRQCLRRAAVACGRIEPKLLDAAALFERLERLGHITEKVVWIGYLPMFTHNALPGERNWRIPLATNFALSARRK